MKPEDKKVFEGSLNPTKRLQGRFCRKPFTQLEIHRTLDAYPCCPNWLPEIYGNLERDPIQSAWNGEVAKKVRESILDGSFRYCDHAQCSEIQANLLPTTEEAKKNPLFKAIIDNRQIEIAMPPVEISLCYDLTCNLSCPSCRTHKISLTEGSEFEKKMAFTERLFEYVNQKSKQNKIYLRVTGSGDPIASPIFFKLLKRFSLQENPHLRIVLQTNGTMLTEKIWSQLENIHPLIDCVTISVDAATKATYEKVRRGGSWDQLQKNLRFLSELKSNGIKFYYYLNFVAQKENFREIPDFVKMGLALKNVNQIFFSFISDWGTWSKEEFDQQCVWRPEHPDFNQLLEVLKDPILSNSITQLGNLTEYRKIALRA